MQGAQLLIDEKTRMGLIEAQHAGESSSYPHTQATSSCHSYNLVLHRFKSAHCVIHLKHSITHKYLCIAFTHMQQGLGTDLEPDSRGNEFRSRYCVLVYLASYYVYIYIYIREKLHDFTPPHIRHCFDVILQLI